MQQTDSYTTRDLAEWSPPFLSADQWWSVYQRVYQKALSVSDSRVAAHVTTELYAAVVDVSYPKTIVADDEKAIDRVHQRDNIIQFPQGT